jgi:hypothetical protein
MRDDEPYLWESNLCLNKEHLRITWRCVKRDVKETKFLSLSLSLSFSWREAGPLVGSSNFEDENEERSIENGKSRFKSSFVLSCSSVRR